MTDDTNGNTTIRIEVYDTKRNQRTELVQIVSGRLPVRVQCLTIDTMARTMKAFLLDEEEGAP